MPLPTHYNLNTGASIPALGFGTWQAPPAEVTAAVKNALAAGYRHIDAAAIYRNEVAVGEGIKQSGVPREEIFITGKLWNTNHDPKDIQAGLDKSLRELGVEYLDLFLMHWPCAFKMGDKWFPKTPEGVILLEDTDPAITYTAMEKLLGTGKVKAIGVCNFSVGRLTDLLSKTKVVPAVNQIEAHPYLQQPELVKFCESKGILIEAYSPLGNNQSNEPMVIHDSVVKDLASDLGVDVGQLVLSWGVQRGTIVLSKSVTPQRIKSNFELKELSKDAIDKLNRLERHKRYNHQHRWGTDIFEEIGEEEAKRRGVEAGPQNLISFNA